MKQLPCPDCDATVDTRYAGNTVEEIMQAMMPHYKEAHADVMQSATPEKHQAWMTKFNADFNAAPELPEKAIKCYDCEMEFKAYTREEILGQLYDHYMKDHNAVITGASEDEKKAWMEQFEKDWATA